MISANPLRKARSGKNLGEGFRRRRTARHWRRRKGSLPSESQVEMLAPSSTIILLGLSDDEAMAPTRLMKRVKFIEWRDGTVDYVEV